MIKRSNSPIINLFIMTSINISPCALNSPKQKAELVASEEISVLISKCIHSLTLLIELFGCWKKDIFTIFCVR